MVTMASADNLGSEFFKELKRQYHVHLPRHVENILKKMGYYCHRSLAKLSVEKFQEIESVMVNVFASAKFFDNMSDYDKVELFGPIFIHSPGSFQLLPGERDLILAAVEVSKKAVEKLDTPKTKSQGQSRASHQVSTTSTDAAMSLPSLTNPLDSQMAVKPEISPQRKSGRSIDELVVNWIKNCTKKLDFTTNDYYAEETGDKGKVHCLKCKTVKISITKDSKGYWKLANFSRHVVLHHQINLGIPSGFSALLSKLDSINDKSAEHQTGSEDDSHDYHNLEHSLHVPIVELSEPAEGEVYCPEGDAVHKESDLGHDDSKSHSSMKRSLTRSSEERLAKMPRPDLDYLSPELQQHLELFSKKAN